MPTFEPSTIVLCILAASLVLLVTDALRYDAIAVGVAFALAATGCLTPREAFSGFSSPAVMLVASMYVFGAALTRSGIAERLGQFVLRGGEVSERGLVVRVVLTSGLLSSVLSNAGVVAILIPLVTDVARRARISASRLLMPLAFGSLIGGLITVIGTSKNLAVNEVVVLAGGEPFGLFEFSALGLALLAGTALFFVWPGRALLPARPVETLSERYRVPRFITELLVEPTSTMINRGVAELDFQERYDVTLLGLVREDGRRILAPGPYDRVRRGDTLVLQGEPERIVRLREDLRLRVRSEVTSGGVRLAEDDVRVVETVVPAGSSLVGSTLREADFGSRTGLNVLAISQGGEAREFGRLADQRLGVGDTLLVQGHARDLERARREREVLVLDAIELRPIGARAWLGVFLLAVVLLVSALGWLPISVAAMGGALALLVLGCVRTSDLRATIDFSALLLIGGMLALGTAFRETGLAGAVGRHVSEFVQGTESPRLMIGAFLLATAVLTQLATHIASAVIMAEVALGAASQMGVDARPFLVAVLAGSSLAFLSPVAHQANAMVVGPGGYRFRDFLRAGAPLTMGLFVLAIVLIPWLWPLVPLP